MQTTFETAIEVIRDLSQDDFAKLEEWLEQRKNEASGESGVRQTIYEKRMNWLKANREKYGGQYVVLDGDRFLGTAKSYPEGKKIAGEAGASDAFVNYLSRPDEEGFMGGW
jgi:hypothetical protein